MWTAHETSSPAVGLFLPFRRVPESHFAFAAVSAGSGEPFAIGAERHVEDPAHVPAQVIEFFTADRVPDLDVVIQARRGQELAVGAESHAEDAVCVSFESEKFL